MSRRNRNRSQATGETEAEEAGTELSETEDVLEGSDEAVEPEWEPKPLGSSTGFGGAEPDHPGTSTGFGGEKKVNFR